MSLLIAAGQTAIAADLGTVISAEAPQIVFTSQAGVHLRQVAQAQLQAGNNAFLLDFGRSDIDPATLELRVLEPAEGVTIMGSDFPARQPGQVKFVVRASQPVKARLRLSYGLKGLESEVGYLMSLSPREQTLTLEAQVTLRNNGKQPLEQAQIILPGGHCLKTSLGLGQSLQQSLFRQEAISYQTGYLYDNSRFKDSVRAIMKVIRDGSGDFARVSLPAGKVRVFAPTAGNLPTFVAETNLKHTPAHEKLELDLGIVPEITVLRTKLRGDQVNVRTDVYKKLALFDVEEEYQLEIENHRQGPVTLLVDEHVPGEWQVLKASVPYQKLDAGTLELTVKLEAGQKAKVNYGFKRLNVEP
ncbi:MAG: hypothetical protein ACYC63_16070 [Armatimonadota bacterium]